MRMPWHKPAPVPPLPTATVSGPAVESLRTEFVALVADLRDLTTALVQFPQGVDN